MYLEKCPDLGYNMHNILAVVFFGLLQVSAIVFKFQEIFSQFFYLTTIPLSILRNVLTLKPK